MRGVHGLGSVGDGAMGGIVEDEKGEGSPSLWSPQAGLRSLLQEAVGQNQALSSAEVW